MIACEKRQSTQTVEAVAASTEKSLTRKQLKTKMSLKMLTKGVEVKQESSMN